MPGNIMFRLVGRLLRMPVWVDEDQTRRINLLYIIWGFTFVANLLSALSILLSGGSQADLSLNLALLLLQIGLVILIRRRYFRLAGLALTLAIWVIISLAVYSIGGLLNPVFAAYTFSILSAGMLLGGKMALVMTGLSLMSSLYFYTAATQGIYPANFDQITIGIAWVNYAFVFAFLGLMLFLSEQAIQSGFLRVRRNEQALQENNRHLLREMTERQQISAELRTTQEFLTRLLENAPVLIYVTRLDGRLLLVNRAWEESTGQQREQVIDTPLDQLFPADIVAQLQATNQTVVAQRTAVTAEEFLDRADGRHYFHTVKFPLFDNNGELSAIAGISLDITERRQVEARFRALIEKSSDVASILKPDGTILFMSPTAEVILGYPVAEILGTQAFDFIHPDDLALVERQFRELADESGATRLFTARSKTKRGEWLLFEFTVRNLTHVPAVGGFIVYGRDVTERRQIETALRASQERFQVALANSPIAVFTQDAELRYTWIYNPGGGLFSKAVIGKTDADFFEPDEAAALTAIKRRVLATGLSTREEITVTVKGQTSYHDLTVEPLRDPSGQIVGITCAALDITERKLVEQELMKAELLQLQLQKEREMVELRERFIATISHEFRTPLTVILSSQEALQRYFDRLSPERRQEHLSEIERQSWYMIDLLDDVLILRRARSGRLEFNPVPLDLIDFCRSLMDRVQTTDRAAHPFFLEANGSFADAQMDTRLLQHILLNLLSNAVKYSPANSSVWLTLTATDGYVTFEVHDQGIGIPEVDQAHLFEPFYRARNTGGIGGTGLGLAIVKESVDAHGGVIAFESQVNVGTTFTVRLPLSPAFPRLQEHGS